MTFAPLQSEWIKSHCHSWVMHEITRQAKARKLTHHVNVIMGKVDLRLANWVAGDIDFYCLDHSYFQRGWAHNNFRAIRRGIHLTTIKKRPDDRLKKFGVKIEPWQTKRGSKIVIIPVPATHARIHPSLVTWQASVTQQIKEVTDRPIVVKQKDRGHFSETLKDAWCVVTNGSVAAVEAALAGIPVFAGDLCCGRPISAGHVTQIERPELVDFRAEWASSLAYASWNASEIDAVIWIDYDYSLRDDLP